MRTSGKFPCQTYFGVDHSSVRSQSPAIAPKKLQKRPTSKASATGTSGARAGYLWVPESLFSTPAPLHANTTSIFTHNGSDDAAGGGEAMMGWRNEGERDRESERKFVSESKFVTIRGLPH